MDVERLLPADPVRPRWSSASALVYLGGVVILVATLALISILSDDHGEWTIVGYSALATGLAIALALLLQQSSRPVAAGLVAMLGVVFFAVFVGAFENAIGVLDFDLGDYQVASLLLEVLTIGASLVALQRFRAPLLMLPIAVVLWIIVADIGSIGSWDASSEVLSILAGLALIVAGVAVDRAGRQPYGLWLHVVGGLAFGGGVLALVEGDVAWAFVGLLSLAYVARGVPPRPLELRGARHDRHPRDDDLLHIRRLLGAGRCSCRSARARSRRVSTRGRSRSRSSSPAC